VRKKVYEAILNEIRKISLMFDLVSNLAPKPRIAYAWSHYSCCHMRVDA